MRENSATTEFEMTVPCPTCGAAAGEPCRAPRSGRKSERSHAARMKTYNPRYQTENRALCCRCGNLRTVSHKHFFRGDDPATSIDEGDRNYPERGWRMTGTLECAQCRQPTVHASLRDACDPRYRDYAERRDYGLVD